MTQAPNVLFIVADDLNSWIGALGAQPDVKTPHIDALARRGTLFSRAYCAAPYCNASRMSVFTGCQPSTTGVYANENYWESEQRRTTYLESFKAAGYKMLGAGKVFHGVYDYTTAGSGGHASADWREIENRSYLWDSYDNPSPEPLPVSRPMNGLFDFSEFEAVPQMYHHFDWGALPDDVEAEIPDEKVCQSVMRFLATSSKEPFFFAAGLYKPHLPWHAPKRFFDMYDVKKITLPVVKDDDLDDVPELAREWAFSPRDHELITSRNVWREAVHGYLAAISYCDWNVGRIIEALDRSEYADNTIVVLWGDNGFHLGEKLHWRKFVLWEEATRVPMIIVPPKGRFTSPSYDHPVSLIDIFPTLVEMCGVPHLHETVDGIDLGNALTDSSWLRSPVVTSWGRGNHSVRNGEWRYTCYGNSGEELYNHKADPREWTNLAGDTRYRTKIEELRSYLPQD